MTDVDCDVTITKAERQASTKGVRVSGQVAGHRFEALVFAERAQRPEWELSGSRISKLWLQRQADGRVVFNWDRGPDVPDVDTLAQALVDFLAAGLADHVFAR